MAAKNRWSWGGARPGAGRPKGSGGGASPNARMNRIAIMLTAKELAKLAQIAKRRDLPVATLAHQLLTASLRKAR